MTPIQTEVKKVVKQIQSAQKQFQSIIKNQAWLEDARNYAEKQKKEVSKLFSADWSKVKTFLEREAKQFDRFQKQIPTEVKRIGKIVTTQRKEFEKLLAGLTKTAKGKKSPAKSGGVSKKKSASSAVTLKTGAATVDGAATMTSTTNTTTNS